MTDIVRAAPASALANRAGNDRQSLADDMDQGDFDAALRSPKSDRKAVTDHADAPPARDKRWMKLAERLANGDRPETTVAADKTDIAETDQPKDAEQPELLAQATPDTREPDAAIGTALPLVLVMSELRKAGSQPSLAGSENADPSEAGQAETADAGSQSPGGQPVRPGMASAPMKQGLAAALDLRVPSEAAAALAPGSAQELHEAAGKTEDTARPAKAKQPDQPIAASRVSVMSEQSIPAPAAPGGSTTANALAMAIASEAPSRATLASAVQQPHASTQNAPGAHVLKIQLRPVELGTVNASLHLVGEQLSVEIQVENAEAYHRLSADRETILSALRGLGFEVDQLTIQTPQQPSARGDNSTAFTGSGAREQAASQSGGSGGDGGGAGNGRTGGKAANDDGNAHNISAPRADRLGDSRYI